MLRIVDSGGTHERVTIELMRRLRLFERLGVKVERRLVTNGGAAVELLLEGEADAAIQIGFGPALVAISTGEPLKVVAGANLLTVHAIYARDPAIRHLADLQGRTVGVGREGALTHQLACAALLKNGIEPAAVQFVTIGDSASVFRALLAGDVDAGFGETEVYHDQERYGVHALVDAVLWRELPHFPNQASFATSRAIAEKRDALVRVLAAHALLYRELHYGDLDAYLAAWSTALPLTQPGEALVQWEFYREHRPFAEDLQLPFTAVESLQRLNVRMGWQTRLIDEATIMDSSLANEAMALAESLMPELAR